jgi:hypothetical protein
MKRQLLCVFDSVQRRVSIEVWGLAGVWGKQSWSRAAGISNPEARVQWFEAATARLADFPPQVNRPGWAIPDVEIVDQPTDIFDQATVWVSVSMEWLMRRGQHYWKQQWFGLDSVSKQVAIRAFLDLQHAAPRICECHENYNQKPLNGNEHLSPVHANCIS